MSLVWTSFVTAQMEKKILAHRSIYHGKLLEQTLEEHLRNTAEKSFKIGTDIGIGNAAKTIGYLHDVGKYADVFQDKKLRRQLDISFDHTLAGAQILYRTLLDYHIINMNDHLGVIFLNIMVSSIISHHIGLPDLSKSEINSEYRKALKDTDPKYEVDAAQKWFESQTFYPDFICCLKKAYKELMEIGSEPGLLFQFVQNEYKAANNPKNSVKRPSGYFLSCLTRTLSSILHQADYEDTAEHAGRFKTETKDTRTIFRRMLDELCKSTSSFPQHTEVQRLRTEIFENCLRNGDRETGCYRLQTPVGSGKTRASMAFALKHALRTGKKRIIYVSPYVTIVSQNYESIRTATKTKKNSGEMIERDSQVETPRITDRTQNEEEIRRLQISVSSLSAPVSFTTTVQFENALLDDSYGSYHTFASLSNAVIIIDELQTVNFKKYHNLVLNLSYLSTYMNSTILICTATPPELEANLKYQLSYSPNPDIVARPDILREKFDRIIVHDLTRTAPFNCETLAGYVLKTMTEKEYYNAIVIVNRKKDSEEIFHILQQEPDLHVIRFNANGKIFAKRIIEEINQWIKRSMETHEKFILVATSIVEVGVDVSFQTGFRELTSLVSLEQSSGRVNRNQEYGDKADFYIFMMSNYIRPADPSSEYYEMSLAVRHTKAILAEGNPPMGAAKPIPASKFFSAQRYKKYYDRIEQELANSKGYLNYIIKTDNKGKNIVNVLSDWNLSGSSSLIEPCGEVLFQTAYRAFKSIETDTKNVLCECPESKSLIERLNKGEKIPFFDKEVVKYSIAIRPYKIEQLKKDGVILSFDTVLVLRDCCMDQYGAVLD